MKRSMKLLSAMPVTTVMAGVLAIPVSAAGTNYAPVDGTTTTFDKYLLVNEGTNVPDLTFNYTISGATVTPVPAADNYLPVFAGTGTPTATATFSSSSTQITPTTNVDFDDTLYDGYQEQVTVDLSSITFAEPGVYRYYIQEVDAGIGGLTCDVDPTDPTTAPTGTDVCKRTLDVYVFDDENTAAKDLTIGGYVMYNGWVTAAPPDSTVATSAADALVSGATKSSQFVNYFDTYTITFGKEVTGNQGSKDKYFKFSLELTSPVAGTFNVDTTHADTNIPTNDATNYSGVSNVPTIAVTKDTPVTTDFYLQDGQYITIAGIPAGTKYTLSEDAEDYTSTDGITADNSTLNWDGTAGNDALTDPTSNTTGIAANIHTGFTNDKQGIIPTGVILKIAPVVGIGFVVVAGVIFFGVMSAKRKESEDLEAEA